MTETLDAVDFMKSKAARKQHDEVVSWTKQQFWRMKEDRSFLEKQWYLNLAMFYGKQYVAFKNQGSLASYTTPSLWIPPVPSWRARSVVNRIRPTIITQIAQLINNKPSATVVPASAEERDMYAAMAAEQIWENQSSTKGFSFKLERAVWWTLLCGNGFMKTWWDFNSGKTEVPNADGQMMGEIKYCAETPFHILVPDLLEQELEEQPYIIHAQLKPLEYIKLRYQKAFEGKEVKLQQTTGREIFESAFLNLVGANQPNRRDMVLLLECYIKPGQHNLFPQGGMYTIIGDTVVQNFQGLPYSHGEYPFAKFDHLPSGKFYSDSSIVDLIPLQKEYNRKFSQIVENANRMSKLGYLAEEGSVDPKKITTEPGQVVFYRPGATPPVAAPAPALPAYVPQIMDRLLMDWNDISGQHEVTHGQVPPGVTAATAISFLQERDETKLTPTFNSLERGIEKVAKQTLVLIHDYWTVEETIKVTGPEGSFDSLTFKGSDLRDNVDIRMEAGSSLPTSKAARQAFILDLMKLGFIKPDDGLEVLDMGGMQKIYERVQVDRRQAMRENLRMSKVTADIQQKYDMQNQMQQMQDPTAFGTKTAIDPMTGQQTVVPMDPPLIVPVNTYDNHEAHIQYHNNYRKSQAFEMLPKESKDLFEAHVNSHIAAMGQESVTMNPMMAAGIPPDLQQQLQQTQPQSQSGGDGQVPPGPMPMPEVSSNGAQ